MAPTFFESPTELRKWLEKNHAGKTELFVGFHMGLLRGAAAVLPRGRQLVGDVGKEGGDPAE